MRETLRRRNWRWLAKPERARTLLTWSRAATIGPRTARHRALEITALLLAAAGIGVAFASWRYFFDLKVYWGAIHYWTDGGAIYDFISPDSTYGFTYTPFAAIVLLPLALVSWPVAIVLSCLAIAVVTIQVIRWFIEPVARQHGWRPAYTVGLIAACAIAFDPLRETFLFGQVNMYLVALVGFDVLFLVRRNSRFAGVGIGLATALKLTPGVFLLYLLVTKRWRAALTACSAAAGAILFAAAVAPDESRVYWTDAFWNTDRVGQLDYISNQSLNGAVARLSPHDPNTFLWLLAVAAVLVLWAVRVRRAAAIGDEKTGFALTGITTCLISPITWVHHLVWVMPALLLLIDRVVDRSLTAAPRRRRWLWGLLIGSFVVLCSRLVWIFDGSWSNLLIWFASNAYVWASLALLIGLPRAATPVPAVGSTPPAAKPVPTRAPVSPAVVPARGDLDHAMVSLLDEERVSVGSRAGSEGSVTPGS